jgi:hypothetical protein
MGLELRLDPPSRLRLHLTTRLTVRPEVGPRFGRDRNIIGSKLHCRKGKKAHHVAGHRVIRRKAHLHGFTTKRVRRDMRTRGTTEGEPQNNKIKHKKGNARRDVQSSAAQYQW